MMKEVVSQVNRSKRPLPHHERSFHSRLMPSATPANATLRTQSHFHGLYPDQLALYCGRTGGAGMLFLPFGPGRLRPKQLAML